MSSVNVKIMFAVFIVLFVAFLFFMATRIRENTLETRAFHDANTEFLDMARAMLSYEDCFSQGEPWTSQVPLQGMLSVKKLNRYPEQELNCGGAYDGIVSLKVLDLDTPSRNWELGVALPEEYYSRKVEVPLFVSIYYNTRKIHLGTAKFIFYTGGFVDFYRSLKKACVTGLVQTIRTDFNYAINYDGTELCLDSFCFVPVIGCPADSFSISPGRQITYLRHNNGVLEI